MSMSQELGTQMDTYIIDDCLTQHGFDDDLQRESASDQKSSDHTDDTGQTWGILRQHVNNELKETFLHYRMKEGKRDTYLLGRGKDCDIILDNRRVSSAHCLVYCDYSSPRMRIFVEDCSANGTFINDSLTKLAKGERIELRSGDEIYLINPRVAAREQIALQDFTFSFVNMRDRMSANREKAMAPVVPVSSSEVVRVPHIEDVYIIGDQIGSGMSGQVFLCIHRITKKRHAVKIIDTRKFAMTPGLAKEELLMEAQLMQRIKHPQIIEVTETFTTNTAIYIVMELLEGGDLFDRIVERIRYTEENARLVMLQILSAVQYLHSNKIIHRDLKPENILLISSKDDTLIKVTDFGLAKQVSHDGLRTFCGTPQYFAPEVLQRKNSMQGLGRYGFAADMWSLGVILYIMLSGTFPFDDETLYTQIETAQYSFAGSEWNHVSMAAKHLIRSLLTLRADLRLTCAQALVHPWITGQPLVLSNTVTLASLAIKNKDQDKAKETASATKRKSQRQQQQSKQSSGEEGKENILQSSSSVVATASKVNNKKSNSTAAALAQRRVSFSQLHMVIKKNPPTAAAPVAAAGPVAASSDVMDVDEQQQQLPPQEQSKPLESSTEAPTKRDSFLERAHQHQAMVTACHEMAMEKQLTDDEIEEDDNEDLTAEDRTFLSSKKQAAGKTSSKTKSISSKKITGKKRKSEVIITNTIDKHLLATAMADSPADSTTGSNKKAKKKVDFDLSPNTAAAVTVSVTANTGGTKTVRASPKRLKTGANVVDKQKSLQELWGAMPSAAVSSNTASAVLFDGTNDEHETLRINGRQQQQASGGGSSKKKQRSLRTPMTSLAALFQQTNRLDSNTADDVTNVMNE